MNNRRQSPRYNYPQSKRNPVRTVESSDSGNPIEAPANRLESAPYGTPKINWNGVGIAFTIVAGIGTLIILGELLFHMGSAWEQTKRDIKDLQTSDTSVKSGLHDIHQDLIKINGQVQITNQEVANLDAEISANKKASHSKQ